MSILKALCFFVQSSIASTTVYNQLIFRNMGYSQSAVGVLLAIGQIGGVLAPLAVSSFSDKYQNDRKVLIFVAVLIPVLFFPVIKLGNVVLVSILYFIGYGLSSSLNPASDGYFGKTLRENYGEYSKIRACGTAGYTFCLILGAVTGFPDETDNLSIFLFIVINIVFLVGISLLCPKDRVVEGPVEKCSSGFRFDYFDKTFYMVMGTLFVTYIGMAAVDKLLSSYLTEVFNLGQYFTGVIALSTISEIIMYLVGSYLGKKGRANYWIYILLTTVGIFLRLTLYWAVPKLPVVLLAQLLHAFCFGSLHLGVTGFINKTVAKEHLSMALSIYWAVGFGLSELIGTLAGGFIIDYLGYSNLFKLYSIFPLIGLFMWLNFRKPITAKLKEV